jgi:membrane-associated protease RseP (regulator of RpoE activity)
MVIHRRFPIQNRNLGLKLTVLAVSFVPCVTRVLAQHSSADEYVTGMTVAGRPGGGPDCPPIVSQVKSDTPAAQAGIQPGDRLLAVDGHRGNDIRNIETLRPLLHTKDSKPSTLELEGPHGTYTVTVGRVKESVLFERDGWKIGPNGIRYRPDATDAEMKRVMREEPPANSIVFPLHYPDNPELYYPGFEAFVWQNPPEIAVGGIEQNGTALNAGVHYGDVIVSVNGVNPSGKSIPQLELLFSSLKPATMTLVIDRDGVIKTFVFDLIKTADLLRQNRDRLYRGGIIPLDVPDAYLHCFESR